MVLSLGSRAVREEKYLQNLSFFTERLPRRGQSFFSRLGRRAPSGKNIFRICCFLLNAFRGEANLSLAGWGDAPERETDAECSPFFPWEKTIPTDVSRRCSCHRSAENRAIAAKGVYLPSIL